MSLIKDHVSALSLAWLSLLGIIFFGGYHSMLMVSLRFEDLGVVKTAAMNWEYNIPFISSFIIPYMSLDLLYAFAFFVPNKKTLGKRYSLAINCLGMQLFFNQIISFSLFAAFPLKVGFATPDFNNSIFSSIFESLYLFDLPYNQAPSLHISIVIILANFYRTHISPVKIRIFNIWWVLIVLSTLFCYQHQVIDLILGAMMGFSSVLLFDKYNALPIPIRGSNFKLEIVKNHLALISILMVPLIFKIILNFKGSTSYSLDLISGACVAMAMSTGVVVSNMYFGVHKSVRPAGHKMSTAFKIIAGLYLGVKAAVINLYSLYSSPIKVSHNSNLFVGDVISIDSVENKPNSIFLNLALEVDNNKCNTISYNLPDLQILDKGSIKQICEDINLYLSQDYDVYVHCAMGVYRSVVVIINYLYNYENEDVSNIINRIITLNPKISPYINRNRAIIENSIFKFY